jgi:hypothetical protein
MYQSMVEDRRACWSRRAAREEHDLNYLVEQIDWDLNTDTTSGSTIHRANIHRRFRHAVDRWITYGQDGTMVPARTTVEPGAKCLLKDEGACGLITVREGSHRQDAVAMIRFGR